MDNGRSRGFLRGGLIRHATPHHVEMPADASLSTLPGAVVGDYNAGIMIAARRRPQPHPGPDRSPVLGGHVTTRLGTRPAPRPRPRPYR